MSSTDYVLRVLFDRLARSFLILAGEVSGGTGGGVVKTYDTVADMLAADPTEIKSFAKCMNYYTGDGVASLWLRSEWVVSDNGTDKRESTAVPGVFYERIWLDEFV